jgi:hypothetical protein
MKLCLHDVTLLAATSVDIEETHQALLYSAQQINFGAIKLLSPITPPSTATLAQPTNRYHNSII